MKRLRVVLPGLALAAGAAMPWRSGEIAGAQLEPRAVLPGVAADFQRELRLDPGAPEIGRVHVDRYFSHHYFGDTQVIYALHGPRAVVQVRFDVENPVFGGAVTVFLFDESATGEGINKFVTNLHSDAIWPDAARPVSETLLPPGRVRVTSATLLGHTSGPEGDEYDDFDVSFAAGPYVAPGQFILEAWTDAARVHVRTCDIGGCP